jgi:hypothetical protein
MRGNNLLYDQRVKLRYTRDIPPQLKPLVSALALDPAKGKALLRRCALYTANLHSGQASVEVWQRRQEEELKKVKGVAEKGDLAVAQFLVAFFDGAEVALRELGTANKD